MIRADGFDPFDRGPGNQKGGPRHSDPEAVLFEHDRSRLHANFEQRNASANRAKARKTPLPTPAKPNVAITAASAPPISIEIEHSMNIIQIGVLN